MLRWERVVCGLGGFAKRSTPKPHFPPRCVMPNHPVTPAQERKKKTVASRWPLSCGLSITTRLWGSGGGGVGVRLRHRREHNRHRPPQSLAPLAVAVSRAALPRLSLLCRQDEAMTPEIPKKLYQALHGRIRHCSAVVQCTAAAARTLRLQPWREVRRQHLACLCEKYPFDMARGQGKQNGAGCQSRPAAALFGFTGNMR